MKMSFVLITYLVRNYLLKINNKEAKTVLMDAD